MLEIASFPPDLNPANPTAQEPSSQGWQHINLLKGVLVNTFPNLDAQVTATPADLNNVLLTTRGVDANKSLPIYLTSTTASTVPVSDFGLSLLTLADNTSLNAKIDKSGFVLKAGDTMTGPLTVPVLNATTINLGGGAALAFDPAQQALNFAINGQVVATLKPTAFAALGDVQGEGL